MLLHGKEAADAAGETARRTFEEGGLAEGLPTKLVGRDEVEAGIGILKALVLAGLASSNGEARRHIQGRAIRVNDQPVSDERTILSAADANAGGSIKLSMGRKKHVLLKIDG